MVSFAERWIMTMRKQEIINSTEKTKRDYDIGNISNDIFYTRIKALINNLYDIDKMAAEKEAKKFGLNIQDML